MVKKISILGSTGSIGSQTLDVIRCYPDKFKVVALSAKKNIEVLAQQIEEFRPLLVSVDSEENALKLKKLINTSINTEILAGQDSLNDVATIDAADMIVISVVGITGLIPTLSAIKAKKTIALANKETLVAGGCLVIAEAQKQGVSILPIDSEHSAIFQCISNNPLKSVRKIIITASGGPFRTWDKSSIESATKEQALVHPNWIMGPKVTIDSATLMNKCLEIIEARWLFDIDYENIEVLIHPQSIVHSMVEFVDGSVIAQMSNPTMHLPIQYALSYPERIETKLVPPLNLSAIGKLEFYPPDEDKFPCLSLAYRVGKLQATYPAVLNAVNEVAVNAYINSRIKFYNIYDIIKGCLATHKPVADPTLEDILAADKWAREYGHAQIKITS